MQRQVAGAYLPFSGAPAPRDLDILATWDGGLARGALGIRIPKEKGTVLAEGRGLPELKRFRTLSRLGAGASGSVYRVHDQLVDRVVALKVLHKTTPEALHALRREFDALSRLDHPNVVRLYEVGEEHGLAFVVMELVEGVDFVRYVSPHPGVFHEERLRKALVQCVVGLDQLHALGKVHRDIKPSNVRVTDDGRVVILDFGLLVDVHTGLSMNASDELQVGTAAYMAPEQAAGDTVSPATDLYAVGAMLYQVLTGDLPFNGTAHDIRMAKVSTPAPDPRDRGRSLPEHFARLCTELLAMNPADRPDVRNVLTQLGATEEVRERTRRASIPPPDRISFVGRESELAGLEIIALREKTETECLHVVGDQGVGKTAFMREVERRLGRRSNVLWFESAATSAQSVPYEAVLGMVEGLAALLARRGVPEHFVVEGAESLHELFPTLRRVSGLPHKLGPPSVPDRLERRWRALNALKHIFCCLAREHHVIVWIDDWEHADLDSVRVAERLFRGRGSPPLLVVLASTPGDVALPRSDRQVTVLSPLPRKESEELGRALIRGDESLKGELELALHTSRGNPYHLTELLRSFSERGKTSAPPASLEAALGARVSALCGDARRVLELLAFADVELSAELVQVALGLAPSELSRAAAELARTGFIVLEEATHGRLAIAHAMIATTVRAATAPARVKELPRNIADALSGADLPLLPVLTRNAVLAGRTELAADAAFRVSRAAAEALAMDRAASFHSLAAELTQKKDHVVPYQSARALAEALAEAGRSVEAAHAYQLAYQTSNAANALDLHRRSAELFVHSGQMEEAGLQCMRDALSTVGEKLPDTGRGALLSLLRNRTMLRLFGLGFGERTVQEVSARDLTRIDVLWSVGATLGLVDHIRGADFYARGLRYALRAGERSRVARALALEAGFSATTDKPPHNRSRDLLKRAEKLAEHRKDPYLEGLLSFATGMVEWSHAAHNSYAEHAIQAEHTLRTRCTDVVWEVLSAQLLIISGLQSTGRFKELDERVQRYQQEALERGSRHAHASLELFGGYVRVLCLDDPKNARARVKNAIQLFPSDRFLLQHLAETMAHSWIDQYEQRPMNEKRIAAAREGAARSYILRTIVGQDVILNSEARLYVELGQRRSRDAATYAARLIQLSRQVRALGTATAQGQSDLWLAHARSLEGRLDEVPALLESAERGCEEQARGLASAIRYRRGRLLGGDEGKALVQDVVQRLKAEGVRNVPRLVNAFVPALAGTDKG